MAKTTMTSHYRRHASQRHSDGADQVELEALRSGDAVIDVGADDEQLSGVLDDSAVEAMPLDESELLRDDLTHDDIVGPIHEELRRRADLLQCAYPFNLKGSGLAHDCRKRSAIYEFLLAASISVRGPLLQDTTRLFERVATRLIESYFGKNAKSMHFGWPRSHMSSFQDAAQKLNELTGEWHWDPEPSLNQNLAKYVKDESCDFVVWLDASDERQIGQLFVLGQCACGNNWQDKWRDLKVETLKRWFNPLSLVEPVKSFATPRHVANDVLREASREAGLVFDRSRLVLAAADQRILDSETVAKMERLTKMVCDG